MKAVVLCGCPDMKVPDFSAPVPRALVSIGGVPLLGHLLRWFSRHGFQEFVLCLGADGAAIRSALQRPDGGVLPPGVGPGWEVTCLDSGATASDADRLRAAEHLLVDQESFLVASMDRLHDCPLPDLVTYARKQRTVATLLSVPPGGAHFAMAQDARGVITDLRPLAESGSRVSGGLYVFRKEIFRYLRDGEELHREPFERLLRLRQIAAFRHDGFWQPVETSQDLDRLNAVAGTGRSPWEMPVTGPSGIRATA